MREHRTTSAQWYWQDAEPDPVEPEGKGWYMVSAGVIEGRLFWFWQREAMEERKESNAVPQFNELQAMIRKLGIENVKMKHELEALNTALKEAHAAKEQILQDAARRVAQVVQARIGDGLAFGHFILWEIGGDTAEIAQKIRARLRDAVLEPLGKEGDDLDSAARAHDAWNDPGK